MGKAEDRAVTLKRPCWVCLAAIGAPCTVPTDTGRRAVTWFHLDRVFNNDHKPWEG